MQLCNLLFSCVQQSRETKTSISHGNYLYYSGVNPLDGNTNPVTGQYEAHHFPHADPSRICGYFCTLNINRKCMNKNK